MSAPQKGGRPRKGAAVEVQVVTFKGDREVIAALDRIVARATGKDQLTRGRSAAIRRLILDEDARAGGLPKA